MSAIIGGGGVDLGKFVQLLPQSDLSKSLPKKTTKMWKKKPALTQIWDKIPNLTKLYQKMWQR